MEANKIVIGSGDSAVEIENQDILPSPSTTAWELSVTS